MQKNIFGILVVFLSLSEFSQAQERGQDPILFTAGSIEVRQSAIKSIDIAIKASPSKIQTRPLRSLENLSEEDSMKEVLDQAERIAKAFYDSRVSGIYRVDLRVPPQEFEIWNRYQKNLAQVFEKHLQTLAIEQATKLEIVVDKMIGGNGTSDDDAVSAVDQEEGDAPNKKIQRVNLRLRREYGQVLAVANLFDKNFTSDSRSTVSIMDGPNLSILRFRQSILLPSLAGETAAGAPHVTCDVNRVRHTSKAYLQDHFGLRYETKAGCEITIKFY